MFRLLMEKNALNDELEKLIQRVERYFKFHDFLRAVMAEGGGYDEPRQVMTRHATLTHLQNGKSVTHCQHYPFEHAVTPPRPTS